MVVPGYRVRMVCGLVTNFHQPGSTLLCLVSAFVGMEAEAPLSRLFGSRISVLELRGWKPVVASHPR